MESFCNVQDFREYFCCYETDCVWCCLWFCDICKVSDVTKLLHALNAVCFSQFRIHAKAAWFDRIVVSDEGNGSSGEGYVMMVVLWLCTREKKLSRRGSKVRHKWAREKKV